MEELWTQASSATGTRDQTLLQMWPQCSMQRSEHTSAVLLSSLVDHSPSKSHTTSRGHLVQRPFSRKATYPGPVPLWLLSICKDGHDISPRMETGSSHLFRKDLLVSYFRQQRYLQPTLLNILSHSKKPWQCLLEDIGSEKYEQFEDGDGFISGKIWWCVYLWYCTDNPFQKPRQC